MKQWTGLLLLLSSISIAHTQNHYTITNGITKEMTGYSFWKTTYYPDHLEVSVNGKSMEHGKSIALPQSEKTMTVRYDYSFAKGFRTGAKEVIFELNNQQKDYTLNFSWHDKWRIIADGALAKDVKRMRYKV